MSRYLQPHLRKLIATLNHNPVTYIPAVRLYQPRFSSSSTNITTTTTTATTTQYLTTTRVPIIPITSTSNRTIRSSSSIMLPPSNDPLVWIDCEMTGLDPSTDVILQIVCFVTDHALTLLDPTGIELIINHPQSTLSAMGPWCQNTHKATGLTAKVVASTLTPHEATAQLFAYIKTLVPEPRRALLAGNSIHADRSFLVKMCPEVIEHLHYRMIDVSTVKECVRRWCGEEIRRGVPKKKESHEARQDILESIEEMRYYKEMIFQQ